MYQARTNKFVQLIFFLLYMLNIDMFMDMNRWAMVMFLLFGCFIFLTAFTVFTLEILPEAITFQVCVCSIPVYKRMVHHDQIKSIRLKRVGWGWKCAVIKNKKGFHFRVVNFFPASVYEDLVTFANKYGIPVTKTKDFCVLEKLG